MFLKKCFNEEFILQWDSYFTCKVPPIILMKKIPSFFNAFSLLKVFILLLFVGFFQPMHAQFAPNFNPITRYLQSETKYFKIIYPPNLKNQALLLTQKADNIYQKLQKKYPNPYNKKILVVLRSSTLYPNGYFTIVPIPHLVLFVAPFDSETITSMVENETQLLFTHELTHFLSLNKIDGFFGNLSLFFFNRTIFTGFLPRFFIEGIAVFEESSGGLGRLNDPFFQAAWLSDLYRSPSKVSMAFVEGGDDFYPYGTKPYLYGGWFVNYLANRYGTKKLFEFYHQTSVYFPFGFPLLYETIFSNPLAKDWQLWQEQFFGEKINSEKPKTPPNKKIIKLKRLTKDGGRKQSLRLANNTLYYIRNHSKDQKSLFQIHRSKKKKIFSSLFQSDALTAFSAPTFSSNKTHLAFLKSINTPYRQIKNTLFLAEGQKHSSQKNATLHWSVRKENRSKKFSNATDLAFAPFLPSKKNNDASDLSKETKKPQNIQGLYSIHSEGLETSLKFHHFQKKRGTLKLSEFSNQTLLKPNAHFTYLKVASSQKFLAVVARERRSPYKTIIAVFDRATLHKGDIAKNTKGFLIDFGVRAMQPSFDEKNQFLYLTLHFKKSPASSPKIKSIQGGKAIGIYRLNLKNNSISLVAKSAHPALRLSSPQGNEKGVYALAHHPKGIDVVFIEKKHFGSSFTLDSFTTPKSLSPLSLPTSAQVNDMPVNLFKGESQKIDASFISKPLGNPLFEANYTTGFFNIFLTTTQVGYHFEWVSTPLFFNQILFTIAQSFQVALPIYKLSLTTTAFPYQALKMSVGKEPTSIKRRAVLDYVNIKHKYTFYKNNFYFETQEELALGVQTAYRNKTPVNYPTDVLLKAYNPFDVFFPTEPSNLVVKDALYTLGGLHINGGFYQKLSYPIKPEKAFFLATSLISYRAIGFETNGLSAFEYLFSNYISQHYAVSTSAGVSQKLFFKNTFLNVHLTGIFTFSFLNNQFKNGKNLSLNVTSPLRALSSIPYSSIGLYSLSDYPNKGGEGFRFSAEITQKLFSIYLANAYYLPFYLDSLWTSFSIKTSKLYQNFFKNNASPLATELKISLLLKTKLGYHVNTLLSVDYYYNLLQNQHLFAYNFSYNF